MEYRVIIGEREETIGITEEEDAIYTITIGDESVRVDARRLTGDIVSMLIDNASHEAEVVPTDAGYFVETSAGGFEVEILDELLARAGQSRKAAAPSGVLSVLSDMPGVVVDVKVAAGDQVESGQPVIIVEAMKMQNELVTKLAGTVTEVHVGAGDTVDAGTALVTIDSSEGS